MAFARTKFSTITPSDSRTLLPESIIFFVGLFILIFTIYVFAKKLKRQWFYLYIATSITLVVLMFNTDFVQSMIDSIIETSFSNSLNFVLTGRLELWEHAIQTFRQYPVFGGGWNTELFILGPHENRITIYHSTIFQVLATGGAFGMLVLGFNLFLTFKIFVKSKNKLITTPLLITYILTQVHGLMDNTQYMLVYTLIAIFIITTIEKGLPEEQPQAVLQPTLFQQPISKQAA